MTYIHRPHYEKRISALRDTEEIKVLTGVRRCGKSTLLQWLYDDLLSKGVQPCNIFFRRFDMFGMPVDPTAEWLASELQNAVASSDPQSPFYVLLDEIQSVQGWEKVVRQLHTRPNTDVYVTGSNAYVLSSDLATLIGGRYTELLVMPLSFSEYLAFAEGYSAPFASEDAAFAEYLRYGGMPALFHLREHTQGEIVSLLQTIYETVILNDVAARAGISDIDLLSRLVRYVFSTSGSLFSTNKIVNTLVSSGRKTQVNTVETYLRALVDALIMFECEQTGLAGKEILRPKRKFYPVDTGLRNLMRNFAAGDVGYQIENAVHNELVRRGYRVTVGVLQSGEVDFIAEKAQQRIYIQVTESMVDANVRKRELAPFAKIADSWPKVVLTADRLGCGTTETGVRVANVVDWLLGREAVALG